AGPDGRAHDVEQVRGAAGDRPGGRVRPCVGGRGEARDAVAHDDVDGAEDVAPVGHAGGGHGVGDERDVGRADEVDDGAHGRVVEVHAVGDELDDGVAARGGGDRGGYGPGGAVVPGRHAVEQVCDGGPRRAHARRREEVAGLGECALGRGGVGV